MSLGFPAIPWMSWVSLLEGESGTTSSGEPGDSGEASLAGDSGDCGCGMIWPERSAKAGGRDFFFMGLKTSRKSTQIDSIDFDLSRFGALVQLIKILQPSWKKLTLPLTWPMGARGGTATGAGLFTLKLCHRRKRRNMEKVWVTRITPKKHLQTSQIMKGSTMRLNPNSQKTNILLLFGTNSDAPPLGCSSVFFPQPPCQKSGTLNLVLICWKVVFWGSRLSSVLQHQQGWSPPWGYQLQLTP